MRPDKDKDLIIKQNTVYVGGSLFKELVANVEAQAEAQKQQNIKDSAAAADKFGKKAKKQNKKKMIVEGEEPVIEEGNPSPYSGVIPAGRSMPMPMPKPAGAAGPYTGTNPIGNEEEKMTNVEKGRGTPAKNLSNEQKYKAGLLNKQGVTPPKDNKQSPS